MAKLTKKFVKFIEVVEHVKSTLGCDVPQALGVISHFSREAQWYRAPNYAALATQTVTNEPESEGLWEDEEE